MAFAGAKRHSSAAGVAKYNASNKLLCSSDLAQSSANVDMAAKGRFPVSLIRTTAGVAELADAQDLGSCGRKAVKVQILSSAPCF
jgi:hypothetical protein